MTVLDAAAQNGRIEIVKYIVNTFNVDVNAQSGEVCVSM